MAENKGIDELISDKKGGVLCKLVMEKAYYHLSWDLLAYMMRRMDFVQKMD